MGAVVVWNGAMKIREARESRLHIITQAQEISGSISTDYGWNTTTNNEERDGATETVRTTTTKNILFEMFRIL